MSGTPAGHGSTGYLALVARNASFRNLWFGQIVSLLGDWFNLVASATLIATLTGSGLAVGGLLAIRMLSIFLASPFAGVAADRIDRRWLLIATDVIRAVVVLGFLLVREPGDVWLLYALTCVKMGLAGFFFPARSAILPDVVKPTELGTANALSSATWSVMLALGAGLGGLVAGKWGVETAFVIDSLTFLVSAAFIWRVRAKPHPPSDSSASGLRGALHQYLDGLRYIWRAKDILAIASHKSANSLFIAGGFGVVQVVLAKEVFVLGVEGSTSLGLFYACVGVGTGTGPLVARWITGDRDRPMRVAIAVSYLVSAAGLLTVGYTGLFVVALAGAALRGVGGGTGWVFSTQLLMMLVPNYVRGRVFSTEFAFATLCSAAGSFCVGILLDTTTIGIQGVLTAMAALSVVPLGLWVAWMVFGTPARPPTQGRPVEEAEMPGDPS